MTFMDRLNSELYDGIPAPCSSCQPFISCNNVRETAERTGVIPNYPEAGKCMGDDEPVYINNEGILRKYFSPVAKKIKDFYGRNLGVAPYFGNLGVKIEKLPSVYMRIIRSGKKGIESLILPVQKVFGSYDTVSGTVSIDPVLIDEMDSPEKRFWKDRAPPLDRVFGEELFHRGQDALGIINRYNERYGYDARDYIEGMASYYTDEIFGETDVYPEEKRKYIELMEDIGERNALTGSFCAQGCAA